MRVQATLVYYFFTLSAAAIAQSRFQVAFWPSVWRASPTRHLWFESAQKPPPTATLS